MEKIQHQKQIFNQSTTSESCPQVCVMLLILGVWGVYMALRIASALDIQAIHLFRQDSFFLTEGSLTVLCIH
jgi:hypothetical protein